MLERRFLTIMNLITLQRDTAKVQIDVTLYDLQASDNPPVIEAARMFADRAGDWFQSGEPVFPHAAFAFLHETGLLACALPRRFGGCGLDLGGGRTGPLLGILKQIGYGDLSTGRLFEGHINALQLIELFGNQEQIESTAEDVLEHGRRFAVWNTDAGDVTRIVPGEEHQHLEGAKSFASGREHIERPLITAQLPDGGRQLVVVPMEDACIRVERGWWDPIGMEASESVIVDFSGTEISRAHLIGGAGDYLRQPWFFGGAVRFAAVQLGGAEALFDETRQHLQRLERTADPYQQQRAGQIAILIESGNHWLRGCARQFDTVGAMNLEQHADHLVSYVHMARTAIERICLDVIELCIRAVGAQGVARAGRFQQIVRDLNLYLRQPAPDAALAAAGKHALNSERPLRDLWRVVDRSAASGPGAATSTNGAQSRSKPPEYFAALYADEHDPWRFETSPYEQCKYEASMAALPRERYGSCFEIGCSVGVMSAMLARRCDNLLAVDVVEEPLQMAFERCDGLSGVEFGLMQVPREFPDASFDLIVISEIGYYWSREDLERTVDLVIGHLNPRGQLLLVHWRPRVEGCQLNGDEVHDLVVSRSVGRLENLHREMHDSYRLDLFELVEAPEADHGA